MLFNTYHFILLFFPVTLLGFFAIGGQGRHRVAITWLVAASLFFYSWWNPVYTGLILASILTNYAIGLLLANRFENNAFNKKTVLAIGVAINLGLLGYFKYANFLVDNLNLLAGTSFELGTIILPLAISFFTFQQVAYLVDAYYGLTKEYNFLHYCLFVTFFPQLIAGPIVHHKEMLPQFDRSSIYRFNCRDFSIGISIFIVGLFKKVVIADNVAQFASPVFHAANSGATITLLDGWIGALAYTFQLYFDFSGYSDMAIGLSRMFGIKLPLNFASPYKANNIIEFWRRWHMTLSRFLRDYLYIPLGGSRKGNMRRYINLFVTMLLGGLWHGAGWTFVLWGALHGVYLIFNHGWIWIRNSLGLRNHRYGYSTLARLVTFLAIVVGWVFFRAESVTAALKILEGMAGMNGIILGSRWVELLGMQNMHVSVGVPLVSGMASSLWIVSLFIVVWGMPNTQQIFCNYQPALETYPDEIRSHRIKFLRWNPGSMWMLIISMMGIYVLLNLMRVSEFLYFQF